MCKCPLAITAHYNDVGGNYQACNSYRRQRQCANKQEQPLKQGWKISSIKTSFLGFYKLKNLKRKVFKIKKFAILYRLHLMSNFNCNLSFVITYRKWCGRENGAQD